MAAKDISSRTSLAFWLSGLIALGALLFQLLWSYATDALSWLYWPMALIFFVLVFAALYYLLDRLVVRRLRELNQISQREIEKLKEIETFRREFLGEVSHELKTPIFAIQGFIDTLLDGAIDDVKVRDRFLRKASKNADRLSNLVNDLLLITQAESGQMEIKLREFPIYELVNEVVEALYYKFTRKGRNIRCEIQANGLQRARVVADRERIQQVLINLIDNGIKYGDAHGELLVTLRQAGDKLWVSISDNGPGIDAEHLDKIFRRFYRVDKSRSRDTGGTGLGLAICKHFIEAHGERIWVESAVGKGATFTFSLKSAYRQETPNPQPATEHA